MPYSKASFLFFLILISYAFIVVHSQTPRTIQLNNHQHGLVEEGAYEYFKLDSIPALVGTNRIFFTTQPLSGDCELYVSSSGLPSRTSFMWKSTHTGPNYVSLNSTDPGYTQGPYYIAVYGVWRTSYKVLTYREGAANAIALDEGEPQYAVTRGGNYTYFRVFVPDNATIFFSIATLSGYPDIFISTTDTRPTQAKYTWRSYSYGSDVLVIPNTDAQFRFNVSYYVGVYAYFWDTQYQVSLAYLSGSEVLTEGFYSPREVYTTGSQFFKYLLAAYKDIYLEARPRTSGNVPILCVSTTTETPTPEAGSCTWTNYGYEGFASLNILRSDPNYRNSTYYIGVSGWPANWQQVRIRFNVMAAIRLRSFPLTDGENFNTYQTNGAYQWFRIFYGWTELRLIVEAYIYTGDVEVYVSNDQTNTHPTKDQYTWMAASSGSVARVTVPQYSDVGWYYIGVLALGNSNYTMKASTLQLPSQLSLGWTYYYFWGLPVGFYKYFTLDVSSYPAKKDLTISTHFYNGDGSIWVGITPNPRRSNFLWKSEWSHGLVIPSADLQRLKPNIIYIGVRGETSVASFFSIVGYFSDIAVQLLAGRPMNAIVKYNEYVNFYYNNPNPDRFRISLQILNNGDADLFASYDPNPDSNRNDWKSDWWGPKSILIDDGYSNTNYYISVLGTAPTVNTTFQLRIGVDYELLYDGSVPFVDDVAQREYRNYQFFISPNTQRFMVSTTLLNGFTELYLGSNGTYPNRVNYTIGDYEWPGNVILLTRNDTEFTSGTWTASVYGWRSSDYFISVQSEWGMLSYGLPSTGAATVDNIQYYWAYIDTDANHFFNIKVFDYGCLNVFVSQTEEKPSSSTAKWKAKSDPTMNNYAFLYIPSAALDKSTPWIYVGLQSCYFDGWYHQYELTMSNSKYAQYLSQEVVNFVKDTPDEPRNLWFIVASGALGRGLFVACDSCTNRPNNRVIRGHRNDTIGFPIRASDTEFQSYPTITQFTQQLSFYRNATRRRKAYLQMQQGTNNLNRLFSFFVSTAGKDTRPQFTNVNKHLLRYDPEKKVDVVSIDISRVLSDDYPMTMEIIVLDTTNNPTPDGNMYTVCGIRNTPAAAVVNTFFQWEPASASVAIELPVQNNQLITVIASDWYGRSSAYQYPIVVAARVPGDNAMPYVQTSIGAAFISIIAILIVCYLLLGMIIKKLVYKAKGVDLIPNIAFWRDLPYLVADGFMFLFTCGRRTSSYAYSSVSGSSGAGEVDVDQTKVGDAIDAAAVDENPFGNVNNAYNSLK